MADVARAAGVSQQTVSRVARGAANVSDATRRRVLDAMRELGFRPSSAARSLRRGSYRSVGLAAYDVTEFGNLATLDGILQAAREAGFAVTMVEMPDEGPMSLARASRRMLELPVDGLIVGMSVEARDFSTFVPSPALPTVLLTMLEHPLCPTVDSDQYGCSGLVADHLTGLGHREIRFVAGPEASVDSRFRELGWRDALRARGLPASDPLRGDWGADSGYEAGAAIARDRAATAVYAANDQMALGVVCALRDAGLRVPEDVSVVGVDDSLVATLPGGGLTTVRFDLAARGREAFSLAVGGAGEGVRHVRIPGTLVERSTTAAARPR